MLCWLWLLYFHFDFIDLGPLSLFFLMSLTKGLSTLFIWEVK